jgi:hypothetical protein
VATFVLLVGLGAASRPASAYEAGYELLDAHWNSHAQHARRIPVVDATGNARVAKALQDFQRRWNAMRHHRSFRATGLPSVDVRTSAGAGCPPAKEGGPADVIVCRDDQLANAAIGGPYLVDEAGHTRLGLVKLRGRTLKWSTCNLGTAVAHEMGHVMGLGHNDVASDGTSVMMSGQGPYGHGCFTWFNIRDRDALRLLYGPHAEERPTPPSAAVGNPGR